MPAEVSGEQLQRAFVPHARAHPERLDLRASGIATRAFKEAWPCKLTDMVHALQRNLNALGYALGRPDGILGPRTVEAIQRFQRDNGMAPDGKLTQKLIDAIRRQYCTRVLIPPPTK